MTPSPCPVLSTQTLREVALLFKHYGMGGVPAVNDLEQLVKAGATASSNYLPQEPFPFLHLQKLYLQCCLFLFEAYREFY
jgi:hypothetical protein